MTAAYRLKGAGWLLACVAVALGFYLVSLRVAQERKKLEAVNREVAAATRDIRALETEFDTRANLVQLEKWNGDTLALAAPTAGQFVRDEAQLAAIDVAAMPAPGAPVRTAALVVPSIGAAPVATTPLPVAVPVSAPAVRVAKADPAPAAPSLAQAVTAAVKRTAHRQTAPAELADAAPAKTPHGRAVALLDSKLLSDATLGDLLAKAKREAHGR